MDRIRAMENNRGKLFGLTEQSGLAITDPELVAIRDRLALGEIAGKGSLDDKQRELVAIAALAAGQAVARLGINVEAALNAGATPVEIKETVYQRLPLILAFRVLKRQLRCRRSAKWRNPADFYWKAYSE